MRLLCALFGILEACGGRCYCYLACGVLIPACWVCGVVALSRQLQHGLRKTNALEVAHIGAGAHMRPCGTYEVRLVLRLLVRLSRAWDKYRGLDHELSDGGDGVGGASRHSLRARMLMSRPSPTLERVRVFADVRVMLLLPVTLWCAFHLLRFLLYALYIILSAMFSVPNTPAAGQYRRPATGARLSSAYGRNL